MQRKVYIDRFKQTRPSRFVTLGKRSYSSDTYI